MYNFKYVEDRRFNNGRVLELWLDGEVEVQEFIWYSDTPEGVWYIDLQEDYDGWALHQLSLNIDMHTLECGSDLYRFLSDTELFGVAVQLWNTYSPVKYLTLPDWGCEL